MTVAISPMMSVASFSLPWIVRISSAVRWEIWIRMPLRMVGM